MEFFEENHRLRREIPFDPHRLNEPMTPDNPYIDPLADDLLFKNPLGPQSPYINSLDEHTERGAGPVLSDNTAAHRHFNRLM